MDLGAAGELHAVVEVERLRKELKGGRANEGNSGEVVTGKSERVTAGWLGRLGGTAGYSL